MAKDIPSFKFKNADEFLESAKRLSKIKPHQALEYLDEALPHFNHYVKDGKVFQVSNSNCVDVVEKVEEYLRTGKIIKAKHSDVQVIYSLGTKYNNKFLSHTIPQVKKLMKEGERGIIYGVRDPVEHSHVFNVLKINGELKLADGQSGLAAEIRQKGYESFKYLKVY